MACEFHYFQLAETLHIITELRLQSKPTVNRKQNKAPRERKMNVQSRSKRQNNKRLFRLRKQKEILNTKHFRNKSGEKSFTMNLGALSLVPT